MVDEKSDDSGPQVDLDRPKRAPPTLDLDAIEISDETRHADAANAANAAEKPARERSGPLGTILSSAIVSAIFGAGTAALVVWTMGWPGETAPPAPAPQVNNAAVDALAARVANVESKAAAPQGNNAAIDALTAQIASVESKARPRPIRRWQRRSARWRNRWQRCAMNSPQRARNRRRWPLP